ncbi:MAG: cysteine--tRNA ligase [Nitrospirae bacterium]|nr:MAG: cysteine--tRNA ligase [Nitrospirota bacterium]
MSLRVYNTLTASKEAFIPLHSNLVRMYVCGVTVYDDCHLGHARSAIVFDIIYRYLRYRGFTVKYVRNFTDIDDKILQKAERLRQPWDHVAAQYIQAYHRDMTRLGVCRPDVEPRATEHMGAIVEMIKGLLEKGYAYQVEGNVYYRVAAYRSYGRLSKRHADDLLAGARVEVDDRKQDPMDFALWKAAKPGEPAWESPWGPGRPGWHIECSAMSLQHLGETFDIHGGGKDLIFPHHENEIAQSCAFTGKEFARYWIHNGFVTIAKEKMSKSLGNVFAIKDIFAQSTCPESVTAEALRYFLLSTHYRSDVSYSPQGVAEAKSALDNLYGLLQRLEEDEATPVAPETSNVQRILDHTRAKFEEAMDDDFNTPKALAELQHLRGALNTALQQGMLSGERKVAVETLRRLGEPLGLLQVPITAWMFRPLRFRDPNLQASIKIDVDLRAPLTVGEGLSDEEIERQVQKRREARARKDFATADRIRQELAAFGITLEDRPDGTTRWKR